MMPINTEDAGYGYYCFGDKQIHTFDGNAVRPPTELESQWLTSNN